LETRLTRYSAASGCGCKLPAKVLDEILAGIPKGSDFNLLQAGYLKREDAAVYAWSDSRWLLSTTDFFMPIVDDAYHYGYISAVNSISDIYAMGGTPILALAILGWPIDQLGTAQASEVLRGAQSACELANIPLAGGHSIESPAPFFGLSVTGEVAPHHLKKNQGGKSGDLLYLSKPLGTGILASALKQEKLIPEDLKILYHWCETLNKAGESWGKIKGVSALTDVTGFGLLGHLQEMCGEALGAELQYSAIPLLCDLMPYIQQNCIPNNTWRNWQTLHGKTQLSDDLQMAVLCDPQTSGGLLVAVDPLDKIEFENSFQKWIPELPCQPIGRITDTPGFKILL
jgi:selenide,water dikinase